MSRYDTYAGIHKALRAFMSETLLAVGRMDPHDEWEVDATLARVEELLAFCEQHARHEDAFLHRALEERRTGCTAPLAADHAGLEADIAALRALAADRSPALYRRLAAFVAANFAHMEVEESEGNALLWSLFTDAEIRDLEQRLVQSLPPGAAMQALRWMVPSFDRGERLALFERLAQGERGVLEGALAFAASHLPAAERERLEKALPRRAAA